MKFEPAGGVVFIGCPCGFIKERILGRGIADASAIQTPRLLSPFFVPVLRKNAITWDTIVRNVVVGFAFSFSAIRGSSAKILG